MGRSFLSLLSLFIFISFITFAHAEVTFETVSESTVELRSGSCDEIFAEWKTFCEWKASLDPNDPLPRFSCKKIKDTTQFYASTSECVPKKILALHGKSAFIDGPNCWGAALYSAAIQKQPVEASDTEFEIWMESPLCRKLATGEHARPGDTIRVRARGEESRDFTENHGFTQISDQFCFSKNGTKKGSPYLIQKCAKVYETYKVTDKCRNLALDEEAAHCDSYTSTYRCESLEKYASTKAKLDDDTKETIEKLDALEEEISHLSFFELSDEAKERVKLIEDSLKLVGAMLSSEVQSIVEAKTKTTFSYFQSGNLGQAVKKVGFGPNGFTSEDLVTFSLYLRYDDLKGMLYNLGK